MSSMSHPPLALWPRLVVFAGVVLTVIGFTAHALWRVLPAERLLLSLVLATITFGIAWPLRRVLHLSWASALWIVWLIALMLFIGPLPLASVALLAIAALAIGLRLTPATISARLAIATTVGLMLIAGISGWLLIFPIHTRWLWSLILLSIIVLQRNPLLQTFRDAKNAWHAAVVTSPRWAVFAIMLLGLASTACWLPTMQIDDLAYHLNLPAQLQAHARYAPDPRHQVWSYAPWAGDTLHGIVRVLSHRETHGALNAVWLMLAAASAWSLTTALHARASERWAAVALFASVPPLVWMAAGMQTELAATVVLLALAAVIAADAPGRLAAGTVLLAGLFALKPVHGLSALPLLLYALWKHRQHLSARRLALALLAFVLLAGSSYTQAWWNTGNPLLPAFNAFFRSPYFPLDNYRDPRWFSGFGIGLVWQMTFNSDHYVEAWNGALGFGLIACCGLWLLMLLRSGQRAMMLAVTAVLLLPLIGMQYARYAYPGIALWMVVVIIGSEATLGRRMFNSVLISLCVLNLAYQANASWLHHSSALKRTIRAFGNADAVLPYYVPERMLVRQIPDDAQQIVLTTDTMHNNVGELAGRGRTVSQHDPALAVAASTADADNSGAAWAQLFADTQIRWVLITPAKTTAALRAGLQRANAQRQSSLGDVELWRLPSAEQQR